MYGENYLSFNYTYTLFGSLEQKQNTTSHSFAEVIAILYSAENFTADNLEGITFERTREMQSKEKLLLFSTRYAGYMLIDGRHHRLGKHENKEEIYLL